MYFMWQVEYFFKLFQKPCKIQLRSENTKLRSKRKMMIEKCIQIIDFLKRDFSEFRTFLCFFSFYTFLACFAQTGDRSSFFQLSSDLCRV